LLFGFGSNGLKIMRLNVMRKTTFDSTLQAFWRLYPVEARHTGVRTNNNALPDCSADGQAERAEWRRAALAHIYAIDDKTLSRANRLDK
jgi:uncharacterized protein (DUF885 family)